MPRKNTQQPPQRRTAHKGPGSGTPADRLVRAWVDEDYDTFEDLAEELIAAGRDGVLLAAGRKLSERDEDDMADEFAAALTETAEAADGQEAFAFAELVLLPVVMTGSLPDAGLFAKSLIGAGIFPPEARAVFADGWRSAEMVHSLAPSALRRVLLDVANGRAPADLPPLDPGNMTEGGIVVLVGAVAFDAELPEADAEAEARDNARFDAFDRWRAALASEAATDALILSLCSPSELADEINAVLEDVGSENPVLDEIADFIATARDEAGGEEVVARMAAREDGVELTVLTCSGRELDSRIFELDDDGPTAEDVRRAVEASVPLTDSTA